MKFDDDDDDDGGALQILPVKRARYKKNIACGVSPI